MYKHWQTTQMHGAPCHMRSPINNIALQTHPDRDRDIGCAVFGFVDIAASTVPPALKTVSV